MSHLYIKRTAATLLDARIALQSKSHKRQKEDMVASYCKAIDYLLETYAINDVIAETDADMMHFKQPSNKLLTEYSEALWNNALRSDRVYDEYVLY